MKGYILIGLVSIIFFISACSELRNTGTPDIPSKNIRQSPVFEINGLTQSPVFGSETSCLTSGCDNCIYVVCNSIPGNIEQGYCIEDFSEGWRCGI